MHRSRSKRAAGNGKQNRGFAPTASWFFVVSVAGLLFVVGVARSEPAAAISGGFFLVALILFAVANTVAFMAVSRRLGRSSPIHLSPRVSAADEGETRTLLLHIEPGARALTPFAPFLFYVLSTDLSFGTRAISARLRLRTHFDSAELRVRCDRRGRYTGPHFTLTIMDLLGFTQTRVVSAETRELIVHPIAHPATLRLPRAREGERTVRSERRRRGEELLEVRDYVPGDDVRRIHWKLLAHAGRLLVRVEEQIPPPQARCRFVLCGDTALQAGNRTVCGDPATYGDRLTQVFLSAFDRARAQDVVAEWTIPPTDSGGGGDSGPRRGFDRDALRDGLAAFLPGGPPDATSVATPPDETPTIVVAPPESATAAQLVSRLRRRARVYIVLPPGMDRVGEARIARIKAAFLRNARRPPAPSPRERNAVQEAVERDIVAFRHAGASHVEVV